jgi:hypothetical protein
MSEMNWYQCDLKMYSGDVLRGLRAIARSEEEFRGRIESHCRRILNGENVPQELLNEVHVELVPESIKSKYNLNNIKDYERFLNYLDDESSELKN